MNSFDETGLCDELLKAVDALGFVKPTAIQAEAIPHLLSSDVDLIALAQTGTGKTAAFGLPSLHLTDGKDNRTQTIVLCPTRELCVQITKDLESYARYLKNIKIVAVYGGVSIEGQARALRKNAQIVVATPGRAKDLIKRGRLKLENVKRLVLDEADEMLSMGFKDELDAILAETPTAKQTMLFSATMSKEIKRISNNYMNEPIQIAAARLNSGAENVKHLYYMVHAKDKYELLKRIADLNPNIYGIVFCRTRRETKEIANKLIHDGYDADALHGELSQAQRSEVMGRFRNRHLQVLVATDVAARGLDVNDLTHIINFSLPDEVESYIHRSGRTGRAGKSGTSIAIIHTRESRKIREIERRAGIKFLKERVPGGHEICEKQLFTLIDKIEQIEVNETQIEPYLPIIYKKLEWMSREELIKHFVSAEFNRFLAYYKNAKDINIDGARRDERKNRRENRREIQREIQDTNRGESRRETRREKHISQGRFTRLFINAGSKNDLNPARLMGIVNEGLKSSDFEIGKIEIFKTFSFFEVEKDIVDPVIKALTGKAFEGISIVVEPSQAKPVVVPKDKKRNQRNQPDNNRRGGKRRERGSTVNKGRRRRKD